MKITSILKGFTVSALFFLALAVAPDAHACSRIVFRGDSTDIVMVGRTLDWRTPIPTNIYVYPAGISKESMPSGNRFQWTSKYGSVLAVSYGGGVTEGMNDKGLVMNGLFCKLSKYRTGGPDSPVPVMSLSVLVSYFLDNFATVDEVQQWLDNNEFAIAGQTFDGGTVSLLHWAVTDKTGKTLIMEFQDGQLHVYTSKDYQVMTNDPCFPYMNAINDYWEQVGGQNFLPGGVRSPERFARASYFIHHVPTTGVSEDIAQAELNSVIDGVSVAFGYEVPGQPNLSSSQWRSIADINRGRYNFKFADQMGMFYIDLNQLMLTPGSPVLMLDTTHHADFFGNVNNKLVKTKPFTPLY